MYSQGKITIWNDSKGYGFIVPDTGGEKLFVHISAFSNNHMRPETNQSVTYATGSDKQGKTCVIKAKLVTEKLKPSKRKITSFGTMISIFISISFLTIVAFMALTNKISPIILIIYLILTIITYSTYSSDKDASRIKTLRTPENFLHLLALAGGWPGALVAQQKLRHKSKKQPFRFIFWITVLLNCTFLLLLVLSS